MFGQLTSWAAQIGDTWSRECPNCGATLSPAPSVYYLGSPGVSRLLPADLRRYELIAEANNQRVVYYQMTNGDSGYWLLVSRDRAASQYFLYVGGFGSCAHCDDWWKAEEAGSLEEKYRQLADKYPPVLSMPAETMLLTADASFSRVASALISHLDLLMAGAEVRAGIIFIEGWMPSVDDIVTVRNAQIRHQLLQRMGYETFILNARVNRISRDDRGQELIVVNDLCFARVICPTTGNVYLLRVPPQFGNLQDAIAWTFHRTGRDYRPVMET